MPQSWQNCDRIPQTFTNKTFTTEITLKVFTELLKIIFLLFTWELLFTVFIVKCICRFPRTVSDRPQSPAERFAHLCFQRSTLTCSPRAAGLALQVTALHNDIHAVLPPRDEPHVVDQVLRGVLLQGGIEHQGRAVPEEQAVPLPVSRRGQPAHSQRPQPATTTGLQLRHLLGNWNAEIERAILKRGISGKP